MSSEIPKLPGLQKQRIIDYLKQGKRFDGRTLEQFRDIHVKLGVSNKSEGSCSVRIGKTEVYAGVKLDVTEPYSDSPKNGNLMVSLELSPMASAEYESGPPKIDAIELGRVVDRGIRESGFIELDKLCIKEGEKVWQIFIDIYAINDDGNMMDVAALAGLIALAQARMPSYNEEEEKVDYDNLTDKKLPLNKESMAFNLTIYKIGDSFVLDPTKEEEKCASYRVSLAVSSHKGEPRISSCQKGEESAVGLKESTELLSFLESNWKHLYPKIFKHVFESK